MKNLRTLRMLALGLVVGLGGSLLVAGTARPTNPGLEAAGDQYVILPRTTHWTETHLQSLAAESDVEHSIYLSAVQLVQINRDQGDVIKVIPELDALAKRCPGQPLRNAIRRLIVDLHLEKGEFKYAEEQLKIIIDESLAQVN